MAYDSFEFIPSLWAGAVLKALQKKTVFSSLCNSDYIGEIAKGNKLKIATVNNPAVKDYVKGTDITYDELAGSQLELDIDQQKYFAFKVEDIAKVQSSIALIEAATEGAGFALADDLDQYLAGIVADNGTAKTIEAATKFEAVAEIANILDKAKAPDADRWLVMPPDFAKELLLEAAGKLTNNVNVVTSGYMGSLFGLNLFKSANVENPLYGSVAAVTQASQISETEKVRLENAFADGVRGLHVYGAKVTRPTLCGEVTVTEPGD
ncbi:MAG: hypothetical protein II610_02705 [Treponema sp.]|nr:hypothetical protein [Treponema sp.]